MQFSGIRYISHYCARKYFSLKHRNQIINQNKSKIIYLIWLPAQDASDLGSQNKMLTHISCISSSDAVKQLYISDGKENRASNGF